MLGEEVGAGAWPSTVSTRSPLTRVYSARGAGMDLYENGGVGGAVEVEQTLETLKPYECMIWDRGTNGSMRCPGDNTGRTRKGD